MLQLVPHNSILNDMVLDKYSNKYKLLLAWKLVVVL